MSNSAHRGKPRRRPAVIALISLVSVVGIGTAAYAYWTTQGSGTGTASTGEVGSVSVVQSGVPSGLFPGGPAATLSGTIVNDNDYDVSVGGLEATVTGTSDGDCGPENYAIVDDDVTLDATLIQEDASVGWTGITLQLRETGVNQDACQDVTVFISYTVTAGS